jgi:hypothetical protein
VIAVCIPPLTLCKLPLPSLTCTQGNVSESFARVSPEPQARRGRHGGLRFWRWGQGAQLTPPPCVLAARDDFVNTNALAVVDAVCEQDVEIFYDK